MAMIEESHPVEAVVTSSRSLVHLSKTWRIHTCQLSQTTPPRPAQDTLTHSPSVMLRSVTCCMSFICSEFGVPSTWLGVRSSVHTSCESPLVAFGKEILTRSSFASPVPYHNIDEASLIIISQNKSKQD